MSNTCQGKNLYWLEGARSLKDKTSTFEVLSMRVYVGITRWRSRFVKIQSGRTFLLDCLFVGKFNDLGMCEVFREWWHIKEIFDHPIVELEQVNSL